MAFIQRFIRLFPLKPKTTNFVRYITSNPKTQITKSLPQISLININNDNNPWIWQKNNKIQLPIVTNKIQFNLPSDLKWIQPPIEDTPYQHKELEMPSMPQNNLPKHAERLIVIRRRKMKRHKLKKLRKRMKFEWAKKRQQRELKKEKDFQAGLIKQCKEAEAFSAEKYVEERLAKYNELLNLKKKSPGKSLNKENN